MKKLILKFVRRFYDENFNYVDELIKEWITSIVKFITFLFFEGFMFWLVLLALTSVFPLDWINLGPGAWHLLNILQLGLILWFFEKTYKFIRGRK